MGLGISDTDNEHNIEPLCERPSMVYPRVNYSESALGRIVTSASLSDHTSHDTILFGRKNRLPYPFFLGLKLVQERGWFKQRGTDVSARD